MMTENIWFWVIFLAIILVLMAFDLGVFNKDSKKITSKRAITMTAIWILIALGFGVFIAFEMGTIKATEFFTGYLIEETMSIDNLFVFILIFSFFAIPDEYQHKALFYGIFCALIFRGLFIFAGSALIEKFEFMLYIFGAILLFVAIKTLFEKKDEEKDNKVALFFSKKFKTSPELDGDKFFTKINGKTVMTPLFLCLIVIEISDIIFAIDSVPAVLAITTDPFIVYTSNIFAIMGLRSLYFALRSAIKSLRFMNIGLGLILGFVAAKMLLTNVVKIPVEISLLVIIGVIVLTVVLSLLFKDERQNSPS